MSTDTARQSVYLVVYQDDDGPYACAFSKFSTADAFAKTRGGLVIDTFVDDHVDLAIDEPAEPAESGEG